MPNTFSSPFSSNSIWNAPIASGAIFGDTGISVSVSSIQHIWDQYIVKQVFRADPLVSVKNKTTFTMCSGSIVGTTTYYQIPLPNNYVNTVGEANNIGVFVEVDNLSVPGRISEGYLWERCSAGSFAAQYGSGTVSLGSERNSYTITSTGTMNGAIAVGAPSMGSLGGVIRSGEWTSAVGVPIPHALRIVLSADWLHYNSSSSTRGYRWPAKTADGSAPSAYLGSFPEFVMGSLLGIPPGVTEASLGLVTEPGKKIFNAFKTYGGYVVDTFPPNNPISRIFGLCVECETHASADRTVTNQFQSTYGVDLVGRFGSFNNWTGFEFDFHNDFCKIFNALRVVTNATEATPKGETSAFKTIYVAKTGSDSNTCLQAQNPSTPKLTINAGLACLSSGDTLIIGDGVYVETIEGTTVPSGSNSVNRTTIQGNSRNVILRPTGPSGSDGHLGIVDLVNRSWIIIKTMTLDGINWSGNHYGVSFQATTGGTSHDIRVEDLRIMNTGRGNGGGVGGVGISGGTSDNQDNHHFEIINCEIGPHGTTDLDHGIYLRARNVTADRNIIHDVVGYGIRTDVSGFGRSNNGVFKNNRIYNCKSGINPGGGDNHLVYNNIIYDNTSTVDGGGILVQNGSPQNAKIYNNTIVNTRTTGGGTMYGIYIGQGTHTVRNNILYNNGSDTILDLVGGSTKSNNLLGVDPLFVSLSGDNYHLLSNSPAIDTGITVTDFNTDFDGNARPQGLRWDIGAYEFLGGAPTDSIPPIVTLLSPTNGSTVSGTITISANATDNVGVAGVRFLIDGNQLGSEDLTTPYAIVWNTAGSSNGFHTIVARARDAAGNITNSTAVTVTVNNIVLPPPPEPPPPPPPEPPPPTPTPLPPQPTGGDPILGSPIPLGALFFNTLEEFSKPKVDGVFPSFASLIEIEPDDWINVVRDIGVKGDGSDETRLIQQAFDLARSGPKRKVLIPSQVNVIVSAKDVDNNFGGIYGHGPLMVALWVDGNTYLRIDGSMTLAKPLNQDFANFGVTMLENRNSFRAIAGKTSPPLPSVAFSGEYQGIINSQAHTNGLFTNVIQLTNDPDLTSVVVANWAPMPANLYAPVYPLRLWLNLSGTNGSFYDITAVDKINKTITISTPVTISSGTPVDYSIENNFKDTQIGIDGKGFLDCNVGDSSLEWEKAFAFRFYRCEDLTIKDVNVINTKAEGGQIGFSQRVTLNNVSFYDSRLITSCLNLDVCENVVIDNCKFYNNNATTGIYSWASRYVVVNKCLFKDINNFNANIGGGVHFSGRGQEFREYILGWPANEN